MTTAMSRGSASSLTPPSRSPVRNMIGSHTRIRSIEQHVRSNSVQNRAIDNSCTYVIQCGVSPPESRMGARDDRIRETGSDSATGSRMYISIRSATRKIAIESSKIQNIGVFQIDIFGYRICNSIDLPIDASRLPKSGSVPLEGI